MAKVTYEYALGNHVYKFAVILVDGSLVPYQLCFERDLYVDRTNVTLINFFQGDDNKFFCVDIKRTVLGIFESYFQKFPDEKIYFETDLNYKRNYLKLFKFVRWAESVKDCKLTVDIVLKAGNYYAYVTIKKINEAAK
jgi:hypothetical protein